jgi:ribosomal protein L22
MTLTKTEIKKIIENLRDVKEQFKISIKMRNFSVNTEHEITNKINLIIEESDDNEFNLSITKQLENLPENAEENDLTTDEFIIDEIIYLNLKNSDKKLIESFDRQIDEIINNFTKEFTMIK